MRHARHLWLGNLRRHARIATEGQLRNANQKWIAPGRTYPEIARRLLVANRPITARDRSPAKLLAQPNSVAPGSPYSNSLASSLTQPDNPAPARGAAKRQT